MNRWVYIILLLLCSSVFAFGQTRNDTDLSLSDHARTIAERNAAQGFNDTIDRLDPDFVEAYLVVADPGSAEYSVLGHCAIRLVCKDFGLDYVFSYESEDVRQRTLAYFAGDLQMGMMYIPIAEYCAGYAKQGRGVRQYRLNLPPIVKQRLWQLLDKEATRNTTMPYDYYHKGCTNSCVRFVNVALGGIPIEYHNLSQDGVSGRELVRRNTENALWTRFFLCFVAGNEVDEPLYGEAQLLIPNDLVKAWQCATVQGKQLLSSQEDVLVAGNPQYEKTSFTPFICMLLLLVLCVANLFWAKQYLDWLVLVIQAIGGFFMTYLIFISNLCCTDWNWLYIAFNPLPIIFWYWRRYWAIPYAIILMAWSIFMIMAIIGGNVLADWSHIFLALSFMLVVIKQYYINDK